MTVESAATAHAWQIAAAATQGAASGAVSAFAQRIAARLLPTPVEKAQIANMAANLELQRERVIIEEKRAIDQLQDARKRHIEQLQANRSLQEYIKQMDKWPLKAMPIEIITMSKHLYGRTLNVILKLSSMEDPTRPSESIANSNYVLRIAADEATNKSQALFGNDVLVYNEKWAEQMRRTMMQT